MHHLEQARTLINTHTHTHTNTHTHTHIRAYTPTYIRARTHTYAVLRRTTSHAHYHLSYPGPLVTHFSSSGNVIGEIVVGMGDPVGGQLTAIIVQHDQLSWGFFPLFFTCKRHANGQGDQGDNECYASVGSIDHNDDHHHDDG